MSDLTYSDVRPEVKAFAVLMERELRRNDHKGGWKNCTMDFLFGKLVEEFAELYSAANSGPMILVSCEAADLANIAMMICDVYGLLPTTKPDQPNPICPTCANHDGECVCVTECNLGSRYERRGM